MQARLVAAPCPPATAAHATVQAQGKTRNAPKLNTSRWCCESERHPRVVSCPSKDPDVTKYCLRPEVLSARLSSVRRPVPDELSNRCEAVLHRLRIREPAMPDRCRTQSTYRQHTSQCHWMLAVLDPVQAVHQFCPGVYAFAYDDGRPRDASVRVSLSLCHAMDANYASHRCGTLSHDAHMPWTAVFCI